MIAQNWAWWRNRSALLLLAVSAVGMLAAVPAQSAQSLAAFANLSQKISRYDQAARPALPIVCFGSSIGTLLDNSGATICDNVKTALNGILNPVGTTVYSVTEYNLSVPSSNAVDFMTSWDSINSKGITPALCVFVYGMNDGQAVSYNSGETFPGFSTSISGALSQCAASHADSVVFTSPDGRTIDAGGGALSQYLPTGYDQTFPNFVPSPVTCLQHVPSCRDGTLALVSDKAALEVKVRFEQVNDEMRKLAAASGSVVIDSEYFSYLSLLRRMQSGNQLGAEAALYGADQSNIAHPNALGMTEFFSGAIQSTFDAIAKGATGTITIDAATSYSGSGLSDPGPLQGTGSVVMNGPGTILLSGITASGNRSGGSLVQ
jgi:hypothetical protein